MRAERDPPRVRRLPMAARLCDLDVVLGILRLPRRRRCHFDSDTRSRMHVRAFPPFEVLDQQRGLRMVGRSCQAGVAIFALVVSLRLRRNGHWAAVLRDGVRCAVCAVREIGRKIGPRHILS